MYKITIVMAKSGKQEIIYCGDFNSDDVKLAIHEDDGMLVYLLHAIESFHVKESKEVN